MRGIIKRLISCLFEFIYGIKWHLSYCRYKHHPARENYLNTPLGTSDDRILVIAPHADDELLSSYTVLSQTNGEVYVYYCGFTGSDNDSCNCETRRQEITALCSRLHVPCIDGERQERNLEELLRQKAFNKIILPSLVDWHDEHRKVNYILVEICKRLDIHPDIYWYSVTVPIESCQNIRYAPMSRSEQKRKYMLFEQVYHSQSFMPLSRFKINERINGHYSKCYAAEVFMPVAFPRFVILANKLQQEEAGRSGLIRDISNTKYYINNIASVRNLSERIYSVLDQMGSQGIAEPHE